MVAGFANCNNINKVWHTAASYAVSTIPGSTLTTGVVGVADVRFPWAQSDARSSRNVALAVRWRYIGTTLNQSGRAVSCPINAGEVDPLSNYDYLADRNDSTVHAVSRAWHSCSWNPVDPVFYGYSDGTAPLNTGAYQKTAIVVCVSSQPSNEFEYEVIQYYESIPSGVKAVSSTTKSHSDPVGYGIVRDFLSSETVQEVGSSAMNRFLTFAKNGAAAAATSYFGVPSAALPLLEYL